MRYSEAASAACVYSSEGIAMAKQTDGPRQRLAISIRQPWAELIMRGVKTVEERSRPTKVRGRIYIYASLGRWPAADEAEWAEEFGIDDIDGLPRGVLVGTVDLYDCLGEKWFLRAPERLTRPIKPERHPMPVWFRPFG
jgi:hypothetical protein